jgi:ECF transporter S component (folate family)
MTKSKKILISSFLLASTIVLARFLALKTPIISINFSFVPLILAAIILGPKDTSIIALLADIIGALLFPSGAYFIGFTISSFLTGLIYGLLLYNKNGLVLNKKFYLRLLISILLVTIFINGILNTIWVMIIIGNSTKLILYTRVLKELIMLPIIYLTIYLITKEFRGNINDFFN